MVVDYRLYKKFDADLIALCAAGYAVSEMMKVALCAYANEQPINIYVDEIIDLDMNLGKTVHRTVNIPNSDVKAINLLKNTKFRCKNMLLKALLRNALIQQPISCLISDKALDRLQTSNLMFKNVQVMSNIIPASVFKQEDIKKISIEDFFNGNISAPAVNTSAIYNIPQSMPQVVYPAPVQMPQIPVQPMQISVQTPIPTPVPVVPEAVPVQTANTAVDVQPAPTPTPIAVNPAPQPTETPKPKEEPVNNIVNESTPVNNESGEQSPEDDDVSVGLAGNDELMKMFDNI